MSTPKEAPKDWDVVKEPAKVIKKFIKEADQPQWSFKNKRVIIMMTTAVIYRSPTSNESLDSLTSVSVMLPLVPLTWLIPLIPLTPLIIECAPMMTFLSIQSKSALKLLRNGANTPSIEPAIELSIERWAERPRWWSINQYQPGT